MKLITRIAFATLLTTGFSITAQAADVKAAPAPAQDPIVQHLKLTNDQVAKIKSLHQQLVSNVQQISQQEIKDGALINVIDSVNGMKKRSTISWRPSARLISRCVITA